MDTITLSYQGQTVALAARARFWLAAHIEALPAGHPDKRHVCFMALYARDVLTGDLPGPYNDDDADRFARLGARARRQHERTARELGAARTRADCAPEAPPIRRRRPGSGAPIAGGRSPGWPAGPQRRGRGEMPPAGFGPATSRLASECSIQLSYGGAADSTGGIIRHVHALPPKRGNLQHLTSSARARVPWDRLDGAT